LETLEKRKTMAHYDAIADSYDSLYGEEQREKYLQASRLTELATGGRVLDAGCGTGLFAEFLQAGGERKCEVFAVDLSRNMLKKAKNKGKTSAAEIHLVRCDVSLLPFVDRIFNLSAAFTLLQNLVDSEKFLREFVRVSKEKAVFVITHLKEKVSAEKFVETLGKAGLKVKVCSVKNEFVAVGRRSLAEA
jgi:ubiquinone/menaquinone biosynthesis C-methylase UbiE